MIQSRKTDGCTSFAAESSSLRVTRTRWQLAASEGLLPVVKLLVDELGAEHSPEDRYMTCSTDQALMLSFGLQWLSNARVAPACAIDGVARR